MATTMPWLPGWTAVRPHRRPAPADFAPALARGDRALLTAPRVVATERAIYHAPPAAEEWVRLGWEQLARAEPHERGLVLTAWAPGLPPRTVLDLPRAATVLAFARERIAWTTLIATRALIAGRQARIAVRRQPGTGELVWMVTLDAATPQTPAVEAELAAALARLRAELGLT